MTGKIGIWIDHRQAVIVRATADGVHATTLESHIGSHPRYAARAGVSSHEAEEPEGGEKRYEERYNQQLDRYYDEVIRQLGHPAAILVIGPGEAKLQLKERLRRSTGMPEGIVVDTTDRLTEPQIVARVKAHYGIDA